MKDSEIILNHCKGIFRGQKSKQIFILPFFIPKFPIFYFLICCGYKHYEDALCYFEEQRNKYGYFCAARLHCDISFNQKAIAQRCLAHFIGKNLSILFNKYPPKPIPTTQNPTSHYHHRPPITHHIKNKTNQNKIGYY